MENVRENIRQMSRRGGRREGGVAKSIESQTAKVPSDLFLWAAGGSIIGALLLRQFGRQNDAQFVGQWAPTFLILGLYNKLVKEVTNEGD